MPVTISIQTGSNVSIYQQIVDQVCAAIAAGRIAEDEMLPSVRALAEELLINPNTVGRAYGELVREGILEVAAGARNVRVEAPADLQPRGTDTAHRSGRVFAGVTGLQAGFDRRRNRGSGGQEDQGHGCGQFEARRRRVAMSAHTDSRDTVIETKGLTRYFGNRKAWME